MTKSSKFLNSPTFKSLPHHSPIVMEAHQVSKGKVAYNAGADPRKTFHFELRLFDGRLNETREQALRDFERQNGFKPAYGAEDVNEDGSPRSPEGIRASLLNEESAHEKAIITLNKMVKDEISKLSGLDVIHRQHHLAAARPPKASPQTPSREALSREQSKQNLNCEDNQSSYAELRDVLQRSKRTAKRSKGPTPSLLLGKLTPEKTVLVNRLAFSMLKSSRREQRLSTLETQSSSKPFSNRSNLPTVARSRIS